MKPKRRKSFKKNVFNAFFHFFTNFLKAVHICSRWLILKLKLLKEPAVQVSDTTKADWKTNAGDQKNKFIQLLI